MEALPSTSNLLPSSKSVLHREDAVRELSRTLDNESNVLVYDADFDFEILMNILHFNYSIMNDTKRTEHFVQLLLEVHRILPRFVNQTKVKALRISATNVIKAKNESTYSKPIMMLGSTMPKWERRT